MAFCIFFVAVSRAENVCLNHVRKSGVSTGLHARLCFTCAREEEVGRMTDAMTTWSFDSELNGMTAHIWILAVHSFVCKPWISVD